MWVLFNLEKGSFYDMKTIHCLYAFFRRNNFFASIICYLSSFKVCQQIILHFFLTNQIMQIFSPFGGGFSIKLKFNFVPQTLVIESKGKLVKSGSLVEIKGVNNVLYVLFRACQTTRTISVGDWWQWGGRPCHCGWPEKGYHSLHGRDAICTR